MRMNCMSAIARLASTGAILLLVITGWAQTNARYPLIPYPAVVETGNSEFVITPNTVINAEAGFENVVAELQRLMKQAFGKPLRTTTSKVGKQIVLQKDGGVPTREGYHILISAQVLVLSANEPAGMFRAVQTI